MTDDQKVITFPTSYFSNTPYCNLSECRNSFIKCTILLRNDDYEKLECVNKKIYDYLSQLPNLNKALPVNIYLDNISENSALSLGVDFFLNITDSSRVKSIKQGVLLSILGILKSNGCHIFEELKYTE